MRSPKLPSRQTKFSGWVTSTKLFASGPSIHTWLPWKRRVVKTGPWRSKQSSRIGSGSWTIPYVRLALNRVGAGRVVPSRPPLVAEVGPDADERVVADGVGPLGARFVATGGRGFHGRTVTNRTRVLYLVGARPSALCDRPEGIHLSMSTNGNRTFVVGVGMTKFDKPGTKEGDYPDWAKEAGEKALADAGIPYDDVEQAYAGYCYGDSTYGQRALYQLGPHRDPGRQRQQQLLDRLVCAVPRAAGREGRHRRLRARDRLREDGEGLARREVHGPHQRRSTSTRGRMFALREPEQSPAAPQMFGNAGREHMEKYGSEPDHYAWIGWKNHKHSVNNPYAQFQDEYTLEEIKEARMIHEPLTKLQCSPTSDGSACAIVASERFVDEHGLWDQAVEIAGQAMVTDLSSTFADDTDCIKIVGYDMSKEAADQRLRGGRASPRTTSTCASCTTASRPTS